MGMTMTFEQSPYSGDPITVDGVLAEVRQRAFDAGVTAWFTPDGENGLFDALLSLSPWPMKAAGHADTMWWAVTARMCSGTPMAPRLWTGWLVSSVIW